jgi:hypothetical protein
MVFRGVYGKSWCQWRGERRECRETKVIGVGIDGYLKQILSTVNVDREIILPRVGWNGV